MGTTWRLGTAPWFGLDSPVPARARVIIDNDFSGDPDGLVALAHLVLSPSVDVRAVLGSHLSPGDGMDPGPATAANACARVRELFAVMGLAADDVVHQGSDVALVEPRRSGTSGPAPTRPAPTQTAPTQTAPTQTAPYDTPAARAIIAEALRDDPRPLYVACGGGLTEIASAWLLQPRIAQRLTVVWIGGAELPDLADPPPGVVGPEYNTAIDVVAARVVLNDSDLPLWQVPRDVYRRCLVSDAELRTRLRPAGTLGAYLYDALAGVRDGVGGGRGYAETYALGDSPLVLLTALQSMFDPDTSSSAHVTRPCPRLTDDGAVRPAGAGDGGRPIRVYTSVDVRLMVEDLVAKLAAFAAW